MIKSWNALTDTKSFFTLKNIQNNLSTIKEEELSKINVVLREDLKNCYIWYIIFYQIEKIGTKKYFYYLLHINNYELYQIN
jgi:hypothetical protein